MKGRIVAGLLLGCLLCLMVPKAEEPEPMTGRVADESTDSALDPGGQVEIEVLKEPDFVRGREASELQNRHPNRIDRVGTLFLEEWGRQALVNSGAWEEALKEIKATGEAKGESLELIKELGGLSGEDLEELTGLLPMAAQLEEDLTEMANSPQFQELVGYAREHEEVQILAKALVQEAVLFAKEDWETTRKILFTMGLEESGVELLELARDHTGLLSALCRSYFETKQGKQTLSQLEVLLGDEQAGSFLLELLDQLSTPEEGEQGTEGK